MAFSAPTASAGRSAPKAALDLACDESCQHAADKLERHHPGLSMERTTVLRMMHKHGAQAREFIGHKLSSGRLHSSSDKDRAQAGSTSSTSSKSSTMAA
jgi:hypothetical protein